MTDDTVPQGPVSELAITERLTVYETAVDLVKRERKCSATFIQRTLGIGSILAAAVLVRMESEGVVSPIHSNGTREVLP